MSIKSLLKERAGPRVQIRDVDQVPSGSPVRLRLWVASVERLNVPDAARSLAKRHVPFAASHRAFNRLLDEGSVVLQVPMVENLERLRAELAEFGVGSARHEPPASVDVRSIREGTGLTQEEFALRYGLDVATVRNWEQGRSSPDVASRTVLYLIARDPDRVEALLDGPEANADGYRSTR